MNILIANTQEFNPQIGGVERVSSILASEFQKSGCNVYFLACVRSIYTCDYEPVVNQTILSDSVLFNTARNIKEFVFLLEKKKIDIVINQAANVEGFSLLCFHAARIYGRAKLISVLHIDPVYRFTSLFDLSFSVLPSQRKYKLFFRLLLIPFRVFSLYLSERGLFNLVYRNSDLVVLLSDEFKRNFRLLTSSNSYDKITAIPNPLPFELLLDLETQKDKRILYVGRLDYLHKRTDRLLEIWSKLSLEFSDWTLDIVGDGPIRNELYEYVLSNKIERINFVGNANPIDYYKRSEIICLTSSYEGLPMVLIEGSYFGSIPLAFNSFSSLSDIIQDGVNGYIIEPFNLGDYERKLRLLMSNDIVRSEMRIETRKISHRFQTSVIVGKWLNVFDDLLKS